MMAILGGFMFKMKFNDSDAIDYNGLDISEDFRFATHKKISAFDTLQDVSKWGRKITVKGDLVLKKNHALDPITELAKTKSPTVFAIADTGEVWQVVIKNIKKGRTIMDKGGLFFHQSFSVELEEVL